MLRPPREPDPAASLHTFAFGAHAYAVEPSSGSVLEIDARLLPALDALPRAAGGDSADASRFLAGASPDLLADIEDVRRAAVRLSEGGARLTWGAAEAEADRGAEVCLCATFRCNLACSYCFRRLRDRPAGAPHADAADMTFETAAAAVEFALEHLAGDADPLVVSFGHTGEPLLVSDLYEEIGRYVDRRARETGRAIYYGMAATNLTLASVRPLPRLSWPAVSLDGPPYVHDRVRVTPTGAGTHETVVANLRRLLRDRPDEARQANLLAAITAYSADIKAIFLHLASFGAPFVTMYPVRLPPGSDMAITEAAAQRVLAGYDDLLAHLLSLDEPALEAALRRIVHRHDCLGRHILRIAAGQRVRRRCAAARGLYAVTPTGDLYPCPELAALDRWRIGSIRGGLDTAAVERIRARTVWDLPACRDCWARLLCGGDCLSNRAMYEPFGPPPDPGMCALTRGLIERAAHLVTVLRGAHPALLTALLAPLGL